MKIFISFFVLFVVKSYSFTIPINYIPVQAELAKIYQWMNAGVDPCEDFYNFTCGGYINSNAIPEHKSRIHTFSDPQEQFIKRVQYMLEEPIHDGDFKPLNSVKIYYKACTNIEKREKSKLSDVKQLIERLGGWPAVDPNWNEEDYEWTKFHYKMTDVGLDVGDLLDINVVGDYEDKSVHRIQVQIMQFGTHHYLLKQGKENIDVKKYLKYMTEITELFGQHNKTESDLEDVLGVEIKLAQVCLENEDLRNDTFVNNKFTISELKNKYPNIPWMEYLTKILMDTVILDNNEEIIVVQPSYIEMLNSILAETPKRVLANFQIWHMIYQFSFTLNEDVRKKTLRFFINEGINKERTRSEDCILEINERLPVLLGSMYVRKYGDPQSKAIAEEMVDLIIDEFRNSIESNVWLDASIKSVAVKKAKSLKKRISYSEDLLDDHKITEVFKNLRLNEDNFLHVHINISRFYNYMEYTKLRKPVNDSEWFDFQNAADVMGKYLPEQNSLVCAAGLLHHEANYFNKDQSMFMNFGRFGSVIARDLVKDFFGIDRQFESEGNEKTFPKLKCIKERFVQFAKENDLDQISHKFKPEDCSDVAFGIAGHQQSYRAYKKWLKQHGGTEYRPNLTYTLEQFYWINVGQMFCYKSSETTMNTFYKYKMQATFGNAEEFSKDWNCPNGSKMNPEPKCYIW